ncbi:MAG TPA: universal stress protein [Spirochaetota bacterium]|nr:universal stress protein [Spirochaetota bacterium]HPJ33448.1 universal stress protein [Spirochaetota bacterium]
MFNPTNILVTTDFSMESDKALSAAADIAKKYHSRIELLYILDDIQDCMEGYCIPEKDLIAAKKELMKTARKKMDEQISKVSISKDIPVEENVRFGFHFDQIIREIDDKKIDLLVTAPHEHHKGWHLLYPHLTDELARKSKCETLLIRH